ncbi:unnamed protein product [Tilletia controversa]|nr:unnamed protein product [Tilletia controversa]
MATTFSPVSTTGTGTGTGSFEQLAPAEQQWQRHQHQHQAASSASATPQMHQTPTLASPLGTPGHQHSRSQPFVSATDLQQATALRTFGKVQARSSIWMRIQDASTKLRGVLPHTLQQTERDYDLEGKSDEDLAGANSNSNSNSNSNGNNNSNSILSTNVDRAPIANGNDESHEYSKQEMLRSFDTTPAETNSDDQEQQNGLLPTSDTVTNFRNPVLSTHSGLTTAQTEDSLQVAIPDFPPPVGRKPDSTLREPSTPPDGEVEARAEWERNQAIRNRMVSPTMGFSPLSSNTNMTSRDRDSLRDSFRQSLMMNGAGNASSPSTTTSPRTSRGKAGLRPLHLVNAAAAGTSAVDAFHSPGTGQFGEVQDGKTRQANGINGDDVVLDLSEQEQKARDIARAKRNSQRTSVLFGADLAPRLNQQLPPVPPGSGGGTPTKLEPEFISPTPVPGLGEPVQLVGDEAPDRPAPLVQQEGLARRRSSQISNGRGRESPLVSRPSGFVNDRRRSASALGYVNQSERPLSPAEPDTPSQQTLGQPGATPSLRGAALEMSDQARSRAGSQGTVLASNAPSLPPSQAVPPRAASAAGTAPVPDKLAASSAALRAALEQVQLLQQQAVTGVGTRPPAEIAAMAAEAQALANNQAMMSAARAGLPRESSTYPGIRPQHSLVPPFELQHRPDGLPSAMIGPDGVRKSLNDPEVCLECMMRDEDMIDVHVNAASFWERESDALFEEGCRLERDDEDKRKSVAAAAAATAAVASANGLRESDVEESLVGGDGDQGQGGPDGDDAASRGGSSNGQSGSTKVDTAVASSGFGVSHVVGQTGVSISPRDAMGLVRIGGSRMRVRRIAKGDPLTAERLKLHTQMNPPASSHRWRALQNFLATQAKYIAMEQRARYEAAAAAERDAVASGQAQAQVANVKYDNKIIRGATVQDAKARQANGVYMEDVVLDPAEQEQKARDIVRAQDLRKRTSQRQSVMYDPELAPRLNQQLPPVPPGAPAMPEPAMVRPNTAPIPVLLEPASIRPGSVPGLLEPVQLVGEEMPERPAPVDAEEGGLDPNRASQISNGKGRESGDGSPLAPRFAGVVNDGQRRSASALGFASPSPNANLSPNDRSRSPDPDTADKLYKEVKSPPGGYYNDPAMAVSQSSLDIGPFQNPVPPPRFESKALTQQRKKGLPAQPEDRPRTAEADDDIVAELASRPGRPARDSNAGASMTRTSSETGSPVINITSSPNMNGSANAGATSRPHSIGSVTLEAARKSVSSVRNSPTAASSAAAAASASAARDAQFASTTPSMASLREVTDDSASASRMQFSSTPVPARSLRNRSGSTSRNSDFLKPSEQRSTPRKRSFFFRRSRMPSVDQDEDLAPRVMPARPMTSMGLHGEGSGLGRAREEKAASRFQRLLGGLFGSSSRKKRTSMASGRSGEFDPFNRGGASSRASGFLKGGGGFSLPRILRPRASINNMDKPVSLEKGISSNDPMPAMRDFSGARDERGLPLRAQSAMGRLPSQKFTTSGLPFGRPTWASPRSFDEDDAAEAADAEMRRDPLASKRKGLGGSRNKLSADLLKSPMNGNQAFGGSSSSIATSFTQYAANGLPPRLPVRQSSRGSNMKVSINLSLPGVHEV